MPWAAPCSSLRLLSVVISLSRQVLCLYYVAFRCVASNLLWSKNQISRLVRAACTQEEAQRRNVEQGFSNGPPGAECQFTAQSPRPPESESLGEALEPAISHRWPENHRWGANTAATSALKPSWLIPIPLVEGEGVILSHFFSHQVFLHLTLCVVSHPGFISTFRRPTGAPQVSQGLGTAQHNHKTNKHLQSCSASGNNPVHDEREPARHGQKALLLLSATWHF